MTRLFLGLDVPAALRAILEAERMPSTKMSVEARWVRPEGFHLTLAFLGDVRPDQVDRVDAQAAAAAAGISILDLTIGGLGWFGPDRAPQVLFREVVGPDRPNLVRLARGLATALRGQGFELDDRFHPHITLARARGRGSDLRRVIDGAPALRDHPFRPPAITLFQSRLGAGGAEYLRVRAYPFTGAIAPSEGALRGRSEG